MNVHSNIAKIYGIKNITAEEFTDKLDMFQPIFWKVDESGWWDMERIQTDAGTHFTSKDFQEGLSVRGVRLELAAPDHQEMNGQVEVEWLTLQTILDSIMVHAWVSDEYIHFAWIYTTDHIFTVLPIKHLVNQYGELNTPQKLATGTKHSVSNLHDLFFYMLYKRQLHMLTQRR